MTVQEFTQNGQPVRPAVASASPPASNENDRTALSEDLAGNLRVTLSVPGGLPGGQAMATNQLGVDDVKRRQIGEVEILNQYAQIMAALDPAHGFEVR